MRSIISVLTIFLITIKAYSDQKITLTGCIDAAIKNKASIEAARTDRIIAALQVKDAVAGYIPQLSAAYNYRYFAIIPTQVVPVGQFFAVPTDDVRNIKFGTPWQQNAGITLYQPVIDMTIAGRLKESRINEKLKKNDLTGAEEDLKSEVINSFLALWLKDSKVSSVILDTLRTFKTLELLKAGVAAGRVQVYDLNRAMVNHNTTLSALSAAKVDLLKEKIYLSFLTGYSLNEILNGNFDFSPFNDDNLSYSSLSVQIDSLVSISRLRLESELASQQVKSERSSRIPSLGLEGFLGANQYDTKVAPFDQGTWHGNSYIGVSLKLPLAGGGSTRNRVTQLKMEAKASDLRLQDEKARIASAVLDRQQEVSYYSDQVKLREHNISLLRENLELYRARFDKGLEQNYDLLNQEIDLQKEENELQQAKTNLMVSRIDLIRQSGQLNEFLRKVKTTNE